MKLPKLPDLPSGSGAPDYTAALAQATGACRPIQSMTAEIAVSGAVGGERVRVRLLGGFAPTAVRLEAVAPFGAPLFIFVAKDADGTLLLPRDSRVVEHGRPEQLLAAVAGVALTPADLLHTLVGCHFPDRLADAQAVGDLWRSSAAAGGARVYLHRETPTAPWRVVSAFFPGAALQWDWRVDYGGFVDGLPRIIRLVSADRRRFDLALSLSQVETNVELTSDVFHVDIPPDAASMTLEDLKRSGLPGASKAHRR
jgi:hypothetical protein